MAGAKLSEYCECGDGIQLVGDGPRNQAVMVIWRRTHSGRGHEERVTPTEARRIRGDRHLVS